MPDLWVDVDAAVIVPVNIMPLLDDTDFKTIETAVVYNSAGLALTWNFQTAGGVVTGTAVTPTTGGNYDWSEPVADKGMYAIEIPASGGASINNDTEGVGWFTGVATGVLPWRGPTIGFRRAALNDLLMDGSTASTNLEDFFDGTGYAGGTAKLTVDVVKLLGTAWLTPAVAGTPDVNAKQFGGAPVTATTSVTIPAASTLATTAGAVGSVTGAVGSVTGAVGSVTAGVTVTTNNDKTGYALTAAYDLAKTAAQPGAQMDLVNAPNATAITAIQSGLATLAKLLKYVQLILRKDAAIATDNATEVTAINADGGSGAGAFANTTDAQEAIRDNMGTAQTGDTYALANGASGFVATKADTAAILVDTGTTLDGRIPAALVGGRMDSSVGAMAANTLTASALATDAVTEIQAGLSTLTTGDIPTAAANADAVWDEAIAGHLGAGSTGAALNAAGSAGDPWTTPLPGAYGAGTAGKIVGDNVNATISSRSSHSAADVWAAVTRTLTAASDSSGITTLLSRIVGTLATGTHEPQSGDAFARLGAPAGVSTSADIAAVKSETASIKAKTDNLPTDPADESLIEAAITSATSPLATSASIAALNNLSAAQVNAEVVDALNVDTYAEPGQGAPAATASLAAKIGYLFKSWRNKKTQTSTTRSLYADDGTTVDQKATDSDDSVTFTKGEVGSGP